MIKCMHILYIIQKYLETQYSNTNRKLGKPERGGIEDKNRSV